MPHVVADPAWVSAVQERDWELVLCHSELMRECAFERGQREVLELMAGGAPLEQQLTCIVRLIEAQAPDMLCSILILDPELGTLRTGAAPNLPVEYVRAIDGSEIGPCASSCGAAAYQGRRVIIEDIETDECWQNYRQFALPHGLRACWSTPIRGADGLVLGTFAMYFRERRRPSPREEHWIERATHLAAIALGREFSRGARRRSEAELHSLFNHAPLGLAFVDAEYRPLRTNATLHGLLGLSEQELKARTLADLVPNAVRGGSNGSDSGSAGGNMSSVVRHVRPDGRVVWLRTFVSPLSHVTEVPPFRVVRAEDITAEKHLEDTARANDRLRELIHDTVSDSLCCVSVEPGAKYRIISVNPAFSRATGLAAEEVVGQLVTDVVPEASLGSILEHYARAISERRAVTWHQMSPYPTGMKHGEVTITPIFAPDGRCTMLIGTVHDMTEHYRAQERLAAQAALLDQASDAILVWKVPGEIEYWNRGAERLYGWPSRQALGQDVGSSLFADPGQFRAAKQRLLEAGTWRGECLQRESTGKQLLVEVSWTLLRDERGQPSSVLAIHTDITEKRALELQVQRTQRLESLSTLTGGIVHDFNNVLTAITGNAALALADLEEDHPARDALMRIEHASVRGADLVRQVLTFSRQQDPQRALVDLRTIVHESAQIVRASLPTGVDLRVSLAPDAPEILANATQVHQVVMNLLTNAAQAVAQNAGRVEVRVERALVAQDTPAEPNPLRSGAYARLVVADAGVGMDAATQRRIVDPFFSTRQLRGGTGLGLAVVHGIIRKHAGSIVVRSAPGAGSQFEVYFPAAPTVVARREAATSHEPPPAQH